MHFKFLSLAKLVVEIELSLQQFFNFLSFFGLGDLENSLYFPQKQSQNNRRWHIQFDLSKLNDQLEDFNKLIIDEVYVTDYNRRLKQDIDKY